MFPKWQLISKQKAALCGPPFCMFLFSLDFLFFSLQKIKYQECLGQELFLEVLFVWLLLLGVHLFSCGHWFRKLLSAIKTTKIPKTSKKTKKNKKTKKPKHSEECLGQGLSSETLVFLFFLFFLVFLEFFLVFGSGSFYRLLRLPKSQKPRKKPRKTKKQKNQSILRNVWAKDFLQRHWFFCFFWFSSSFFWFLVPEAFTGY